MNCGVFMHILCVRCMEDNISFIFIASGWLGDSLGKIVSIRYFCTKSDFVT